MSRKPPSLEACSRGGKKTAAKFPKSAYQAWGHKGGTMHKPNLEGCAAGGRKSSKAKWEKKLAEARAAEAIAKAPLGLSGQVKTIIQNPSIPWKGVF